MKAAYHITSHPPKYRRARDLGNGNFRCRLNRKDRRAIRTAGGTVTKEN